MVSPLDQFEAKKAAKATEDTRERGEESREAIALFHDACNRYVEQAIESEYTNADVIAFDSTLGQEKYLGKIFGTGGTFPSPTSIAMIFEGDGTYQLINDGGAGGILTIPASDQYPHPVSVLPVDRGEVEITRSHLPSGRRRSKWQAYDEEVFLANNSPDDIKRAAGRVESEISTLKALAAHRIEQEAINNQ